LAVFLSCRLELYWGVLSSAVRSERGVEAHGTSGEVSPALVFEAGGGDPVGEPAALWKVGKRIVLYDYYTR